MIEQLVDGQMEVADHMSETYSLSWELPVRDKQGEEVATGVIVRPVQKYQEDLFVLSNTNKETGTIQGFIPRFLVKVSGAEPVRELSEMGYGYAARTSYAIHPSMEHIAVKGGGHRSIELVPSDYFAYASPDSKLFGQYLDGIMYPFMLFAKEPNGYVLGSFALSQGNVEFLRQGITVDDAESFANMITNVFAQREYQDMN
jgi:hypothetical protein